MKYKATRDVPEKSWKAGQTYEVSEMDAKQWLNDGALVPADQGSTGAQSTDRPGQATGRKPPETA